MSHLCKGGMILSHEKCQLTIHYDCQIEKINNDYFIVEGFDFRIDVKFETPKSSVIYEIFKNKKKSYGISNEQEVVINGLRFETFVHTYSESLYYHSISKHWYCYILKDQDKEFIIKFLGDDRIPQNYKEMIDVTIKSIKLL